MKEERPSQTTDWLPSTVGVSDFFGRCGVWPAEVAMWPGPIAKRSRFLAPPAPVAVPDAACGPTGGTAATGLTRGPEAVSKKKNLGIRRVYATAKNLF